MNSARLKNLIELLTKALTSSFAALSKRQPVTSDKAQKPQVVSMLPSTIKEAAPEKEHEVKTNTIPILPEEKQEEAVAQKTGFLICPIKMDGQSLTPVTVKISSVLDHSGTAIEQGSGKHWGKSAKDQKVKAFNGEIGQGPQCPEEPCGYPNSNSIEFFSKKEINYVGVASDGSKKILQYDGHAGYDFPYPKGTPVVAPADGKLYKAASGKDVIYGANWNIDGSFYIEHESGFVTWFRHCEKLTDSLELQISNDFTKYCDVKQGDVIAYVSKKGTRAVHLHFEVRNPQGNIVDPYRDKLWQDSV